MLAYAIRDAIPEVQSDRRFEWRELELRNIVMPIGRGGDYQREATEARIAAIVKDFDPLAVGTPEVAFYDGHYWDWDGGGRVGALRRMGVQTAMCRIAYGYTEQELARAFALQGDRRTTVSKKDIVRAMLAAGEPAYLAAMELVEHYGYTLDMSRHGGGARTNALRVHGSLVWCIRTPSVGLKVLDLALKALSAGWPGHRFQSGTLNGVASFVAVQRPRAPMPVNSTNYFDNRLAVVLSGHPENELHRRARELTPAKGSKLQDRLPVALTEWYNSGLRSNRLPDWPSRG